MPSPSGEVRPLPGTQRPRRFVPRFHYELIACGLGGHRLVGHDAAELRPEDALFARTMDGTRWHRCLRCDSWLPLAPPEKPGRQFPPAPAEIELPLRGKPLRDKFVLRIIAIDRALHFVVLALLAVAVFLFAAHERTLRDKFYRVVADLENGIGGGPVQTSHTGIVHELDRLFSLSEGKLRLVGTAIALYALLEGVEAIGLWFLRRWAEYLTLVATAVFLPIEIWELAKHLTWFKLVALVVNLAIVVYLLLAKRLFGLRGGARAEEEARERDLAWSALEASSPERFAVPTS